MATATTPSSVPALSLPGYTLGHSIAEGGMAEVFRATQHSLGREVAVKIMKDGDASLADRFQREARLVATLNHPHIVHIYDVGQLDDGRPYLSMELLPGGDLRQRVRDGLKGEEVLRILRQLAQGLQAIHDRGITHRDIKPANILFRANGDAVLTDFGIAKAIDIDVELTHAGVVVGSPAYSSPEQLSSKPVDARSDLYSLGVVLTEMLLGRNPYRGPDYATTMVNQLQQSAPMLPAWHAPWQPIVDRLLAKKPADRFPHAGALLGALDKINLEPLHPEEDSDCTTTKLHAIMPPPPLVRQRRWQAVFVLAFVALALAGLFGWLQLRPDPQVKDWLVLAEERYGQSRLSSPAGDSAVFYYRQALEAEPDNEKARQGLAAVLRRHAELAQTAYRRGDFAAAQEQVRFGLAVEPGDPTLMVLNDAIGTAMLMQHVAAAQQARSKGDLEAAQQHVTAGLVVKPADATLLALRDDLRAELKARDAERDRSRQAQARTVKKAPVPETPPEEKKGFFSRLFGR
jgi:hypothetical protein